jgi:hypothetical protein
MRVAAEKVKTFIEVPAHALPSTGFLILIHTTTRIFSGALSQSLVKAAIFQSVLNAQMRKIAIWIRFPSPVPTPPEDSPLRLRLRRNARWQTEDILRRAIHGEA